MQESIPELLLPFLHVSFLILFFQLISVLVCFVFYLRIGLTLADTTKSTSTTSRVRKLTFTFSVLTVAWAVLTLPYQVFHFSLFVSIEFRNSVDVVTIMEWNTGFQALRHSYATVNCVLLFICYRPLQGALVKMLKCICFWDRSPAISNFCVC